MGPEGPAGEDGAAGPSATDEILAVVSSLHAARENFVVVQCENGMGGFPTGSGTVTTSGLVVTAQHVVASPAVNCRVLHADQGNVVVYGDVLSIAPSSMDLAELTVDWEVTPPPGIARVTYTPEVGELVVATGHPNVLINIQYSTGIVTATGDDQVVDWPNAFYADYASSGGGSGGAVFNHDGEWFGIHVGGFNNGLELSIGLPFP